MFLLTCQSTEDLPNWKSLDLTISSKGTYWLISLWVSRFKCKRNIDLNFIWLNWMQNFGEIVDFEVDETVPTLVIRYKARKDAEMALVKGRLFPSAVLDVNWHLLLDSSGNNRKKERLDDESATGHDAGSVSPDEEEEENEVFLSVPIVLHFSRFNQITLHRVWTICWITRKTKRMR